MGKASRAKKGKKAKAISAFNETVPDQAEASTSHQAQDHLRKTTSQLLQSESTHARTHKQISAAEEGRRRTIFLLMLIILVVSFAVYFKALFNGFVADDFYAVVRNPWIRDFKSLTKIFTSDVVGFADPRFQIKTNFYRPMFYVINMCSFHLFGLNPWGYHLVNILFHAGNSVLVFMLTSRLLRADPPAVVAPLTWPSVLSFPPFIAALLFATHPIHTESVTWITGLGDVDFTFFYLHSLWLYIRYKEGFRIGYLLSLASFFASTLCKEPAVTFPLILIGYDYAFRKKEDHLLTLVMRYIPYFIIVGIYMALRTNALKFFIPVAPADITEMYYKGLSTWQYVINVFPLFMEYLKDLFSPFNLNFYHTFHPIGTLFNIKGMLSMAGTVAYLLIVFLAWKRNKAIFFGLLFIIVPLLPAFYIKALSGNAYGERYLYLSSFGFVVVFAASFDILNKKMARYSIVTTLIVLTVVGLYSVRTITRNPVWKDDLTLLTDTVKKSPEAELPHRNLGLVLIGMDRYGEAIEQFRQAVGLCPKDPFAHKGLADAYAKSGMAKQAEDQYQIATKLNPEGLINKATELANKGLIKQAIEQYEKALAIDPNSGIAHYNLGITYAKWGKIDKATEHLEASVRLQPNIAAYRNGLGLVYEKEMAYDKAIEQFRAAVDLAPSEEAYSRNLEEAQGRPHVAGF